MGRLPPCNESSSKMDIALRARHDALDREFLCRSTELRLLKVEPAKPFRRTIEAFCVEPRAARFDMLLESYATCCLDCIYLTPRGEPESLAALTS